MLTNDIWALPASNVARSGERSLEDVFGPFWRVLPSRSDAYQPPIDVWESDEAYQVLVDVPGFRMEELEVVMQGDELSISGARSEEKRAEGVSLRHRERSEKSFKRLVKLPELVNLEGVTAQLNNGVLCVALPKSEESKARRIKVQG